MSSSDQNKVKTVLLWVMQLLAAGIFFQTLFFKFTGAPESVYIFETIGMAPWGRIGSGVVELLAGLLLLWPKRAWLGAIIGLGTMTAAIIFHLTILGIVVQGDGGTLFYLAITVFTCCLLVLLLRRKQALKDISYLFGSRQA